MSIAKTLVGEFVLPASMDSVDLNLSISTSFALVASSLGVVSVTTGGVLSIVFSVSYTLSYSKLVCDDINYTIFVTVGCGCVPFIIASCDCVKIRIELPKIPFPFDLSGIEGDVAYANSS